ncbi:MAG TPA: TIGR04282 family arsenosugar biosynthesis glycosyltransferase [Thermomicrobiales bacterium]|jgi:rSAM/selenodomain-associated transferase 1
MSPNLLIIVARAPVPGTTKTRLAATIGHDRACALYRAFLADLANRFRPSPGARVPYDLAWAFTPADADFRAILARLATGPIDAATRFVPQGGATFNDRLTSLFRWGFLTGYQRVAIMASDSPHLPAGVAVEAFTSLATRDVTLGRVADGGYYLIGLSRFVDLFRNLPMSTGDAADAVVARAGVLGLRLGEITPSFDVDEERDLGTLRLALVPDGAAAPVTWSALRRLGLVDAALTNVDFAVTSDAMAGDD